jgi:DedD protein
MDQQLKERLIGAIVLVSFAVIFIPMFFTGTTDSVLKNKENVSIPKELEFVSKLKPMTGTATDSNIKNIEFAPVVEESLAPVVEESLAPVVEESLAPVVEESLAPVVEESLAPVVEEIPFNQEMLKNNAVGQMNWVVQVGSFSSKDNAEKLNQKVKKAGFRSFVNPITQNNKIMYQVCSGPEYNETDAMNLLKGIKNKMKLNGIIKKYP